MERPVIGREAAMMSAAVIRSMALVPREKETVMETKIALVIWFVALATVLGVMGMTVAPLLLLLVRKSTIRVIS